MASERRFPTEKLLPTGGSINAEIFENRSTGILRQLRWAVEVEFAPVRYGDQDERSSLAGGWIPWTFNDWRALTGATFEKATRLKADGPEHFIRANTTPPTPFA